MLLTGAYPRDAAKYRDPLQMVLEGEIIPIENRDEPIPKKLAAAVNKSLALDPEQRFPDADAMLDALAKISEE